MMNLDHEKDSAEKWLRTITARFPEESITFPPIYFAIAWRAALFKEVVDPLEIIRIRDESRHIKEKYDISVFALCNTMEEVVKKLTRPLEKWELGNGEEKNRKQTPSIRQP